MEYLMYILAKVVSLGLDVATFAMLLIILLPIFIDVEGSRLYEICVFVAEPFILPFRFILYKLNIGQDLPIDLSFLTAYICLNLISMSLGAFVPI